MIVWLRNGDSTMPNSISDTDGGFDNALTGCTSANMTLTKPPFHYLKSKRIHKPWIILFCIVLRPLVHAMGTTVLYCPSQYPNFMYPHRSNLWISMHQRTMYILLRFRAPIPSHSTRFLSTNMPTFKPI